MIKYNHNIIVWARVRVVLVGIIFLSSTICTTGFVVTSANQRKFITSSAFFASTSESSFDNSRVIFRQPTHDEIPTCFEIESASYPTDEAASLSSLQYRYDQALPYFQCVFLRSNQESNQEKKEQQQQQQERMIGFICSTRCDDFENEDVMSTHIPTGSKLAIHSVVVKEEYRRKGVATSMLNHYMKYIQDCNDKNNDKNNDDCHHPPIQSVVLLAKSHLLSFYVDCNFQVNRPSPIVHGKEQWYELETHLDFNNSNNNSNDGDDDDGDNNIKKIKNLPSNTESWYCKTETFKRPFPYIKPYLEEHKDWVHDLRQNQGICITSGYRVDSEGRPGGGGLMFLAAESYDKALEIILQDPLVANDCVDWELNGWIGQVGDIQMR